VFQTYTVKKYWIAIGVISFACVGCALGVLAGRSRYINQHKEATLKAFSGYVKSRKHIKKGKDGENNEE
jgi:hypothetical protein